MSVCSLPEWKQLLLERKRREEEERERREKEEEKKLASMPAWKRGIIQRRKAKQENLGDRERDKDICLLQVDVRSPSDGLSDTDSSITVNLGSDTSLSPDPGQWLDAEPKPVSQVSVETIVPVHENPFIRTQNVWRKGRDPEIGTEFDIKDRDKPSPVCQDVETGRGRDIELKIERFRDLTQGWDKDKARDRSLGSEKENNREGWEKDRKLQKDAAREQEKEIQPLSGSFPSIVPCLRTIRADNIIIIEEDRKGSDERRGRWREVDRERPEEDQHGKRGMKMDLREILAGGGSVTEIRASEVLIIKPSISTEERTVAGIKGGEDGEMKSSVESLGRELRADMSWLREKEKERPWGQATVINKDDRNDSSDDSVFVERGGRVSQLLSKFGEHPKPPSRSKSSDNFLQPGRRNYSGDQDDQQSEERKGDGTNASLKNVPKRSYSFSDRVLSAVENGDERCTHSDKNVAPWVDAAKLKLGCGRLVDKERFGNYRDVKNEGHKGEGMEIWKKHRSELRKVEPVDKRAAEKVVDADGDRGFTIASVRNTEGISFARRVPIRQDGRGRAEREVKRLTREKSLENVEKDSDAGQAEAQVNDKADVRREDGFECSDAGAASGDPLSPNEAQCRQDSACSECSSLLCTVTDRVPQRGPEWSGTGPQGPFLTRSTLSQQTENLISKVEKLGDTIVYMNDRGDKTYNTTPEMTKESQQEAQTESLTHSLTTRSPKRIAPFGIPQGPLEIQIPRTVFYVAEDMLERKKSECQSSDGQDRDEGQKVERRDSWRIGKPLSRIESLREKIRQRELEKQRQREAQGGDGNEAAEICDAQTGEDRYEERGSETDKEWEAAAHMQTRPVEAETEAAEQTSTTACDVKQEVGMEKTCPQLPVSVLHSQDESTGEVTGECSSTASQENSDSSQISEDEDDPLKHVEVQQGSHRGRNESTKEEEEEEEEAKKLSEEKISVDSTSSFSSSPPHPNSLEAMSRIYNLDTVGSRSGLCLREKTADVPSSVHLVKMKPLISNSQHGDSKALTGDNMCGVQRQIEQFKLKEQEVLKSCSNTSKDRETKGQQSPKGVLKQQIKKDEVSPELNSKDSPQSNCSPASQLKQTIPITPSFLRSQSPENSLKPINCAPTPASSPSSPSPANSPSISPSPSPSPKLFTIRSASGGQVKRGTTITITPKRPVTGAVKDSKPRPTTTESAKGPSQQTTLPVDEPGKKKYPAVEEIEVIGGYQNLEKSCLVKNRRTPKNGKVCFDEDQLEQVCEYPSETFMLTQSPLPPDLESNERLQGDEAQEDEGEGEEGEAVFKTMKSVGIATGPRLRVDESCPW